MAIRNPNANESIKEYDELQTAEINGATLVYKGSTNNCNGITENGFWMTTSSTIGIPSGHIYGGILVCMTRGVGGDTMVQIHVSVNDGDMKGRGRAAGTEWSTRVWK